MGDNNGNENVKYYYVSKESILILQATVIGVLQSRRRAAAAAFQFNFAHCGCWDMCSLALSTSQSSSSSSKSSVHFAIPSGKRFPATHEPPSHMPQLILTQYKSDFIIIRFRWDYLEHFQPRGGRFPGFDNFRRGGVETEYLQSVFPSESFPAWQTINTGSYFFFLNYFLAYIIGFVELLFIFFRCSKHKYIRRSVSCRFRDTKCSALSTHPHTYPGGECIMCSSPHQTFISLLATHE